MRVSKWLATKLLSLPHANLDSNIASFEVVTASEIILNASPTSYSDLYWALRGGGNNFGVITKFNMETVPQGLMWGGTRVHVTPDYPKLIDAFATMVESASQDPKAVQILSFATTAGNPAVQLQLEYLEPVDESNPPGYPERLLGHPICPRRNGQQDPSRRHRHAQRSNARRPPLLLLVWHIQARP